MSINILTFSHFLILAFIHSHIQSFYHSPIHSFYHSPIHSFYHSPILSFPHSPIHSFYHSPILKLFCFFTLISVAGCKKDNNGGVPVTVVDIALYINNPSYVSLNAVGGWKEIPGGVRGILVYRASSSEFKAYDQNCTYNSSAPCATVHVDATNILAVDTCCHSKFSIFDGSVAQGPATFPLKQYNTNFDGNILRIYN